MAYTQYKVIRVLCSTLPRDRTVNFMYPVCSESSTPMLILFDTTDALNIRRFSVVIFDSLLLEGTINAQMLQIERKLISCIFVN